MTREERRAWDLCRSMYEQYHGLCGCADNLHDAKWKTAILKSLDNWVDRELERLKENSSRMILKGGQAIIKEVVNLEVQNGRISTEKT